MRKSEQPQETLKKATNPRGNLEERIERLIELEAEIFEKNLQFLRATLANKWKYRTLQKNYERNQRNIKFFCIRGSRVKQSPRI